MIAALTGIITSSPHASPLLCVIVEICGRAGQFGFADGAYDRVQFDQPIGVCCAAAVTAAVAVNCCVWILIIIGFDASI